MVSITIIKTSGLRLCSVFSLSQNHPNQLLQLTTRSLALAIPIIATIHYTIISLLLPLVLLYKLGHNAQIRNDYLSG